MLKKSTKLQPGLLKALFCLTFMVTFSNAPIAKAQTTIKKDTLVIFAASSLTAPLNEIAKNYEAEHNVSIALSFGSSSALARQLAFGAPGDIFISAHKEWITWLKANTKTPTSLPIPLAKNNLVLASRVDTAKKQGLVVNQSWQSYLDALGNNRLIVGEPTTVPLGQYTKEYLEKAQLWGDVKGKLAPARDGLSATMMVKSGQSPFGILYQNDVRQNTDLIALKPLYENEHSPITYFALDLQDDSKPSAQALDPFMAYLASPKAGLIFCKYGLLTEHCPEMKQN